MLIQKYFETRMALIDQGLKQALSFTAGNAAQLQKAMRYAVIPGGKRWRPLLMVAIYEVLKSGNKTKGMADVILAASAIELVHNAALIHDDLPSIKNNSQRRGMPTVHQKWDNAIAILAGDALYTLAFEMLGNISNAEKALAATRTLSSYTKSYGMIGGQLVDIEMKRRVMKIATLRFIDAKKVVALLQASADIACLLADADENDRAVMNTYAYNLGMAYKMIENIAADYSRGGEDLDFSEDFVPAQRRSYTGLMGFDKAKSGVETLLRDARRSIKPYPNHDALEEFIQMIEDLLP